MTEVLGFTDYKAFLNAIHRSRKGERGFVTELAEAAGCQRPYISQVLHSHVHLTPDHACNLARFLALDEIETEYFLALVDLARAGSPRLQAHLRKKLDSLRKQAQNLAARVKQPSVADQKAQARFYSSWHFAAIHVLVSIPEFQTPAAIARKLSLTLPKVQAALRELKTMGILKNEGERWRLAAGDLHIPKDSPLNGVNHQNWRARAVLDSQDLETDGVHYSSVFTLSERDFARLKAMLLRFIDEQRAIISPSACEELACFTCDLFKP